MFPTKVYELVVEEWAVPFDNEIEIESVSPEQITFNINFVGLKYFDDQVLVRFVVYRTGGYHVFFTFDRIAPTYEVLKLVNAFNAGNSYLKAAIVNKTGGSYLELHYGSLTRKNSSKAIAREIGYLLSSMGDEHVLNTLVPLTKITV